MGQTDTAIMVAMNATPVPELLDHFSKPDAVSIFLALAALLLMIGEPGRASTLPIFWMSLGMNELKSWACTVPWRDSEHTACHSRLQCLHSCIVSAGLLRILFAGRKGDIVLFLGPAGAGKTTMYLQLRDGTLHNGTVASMAENVSRCMLIHEKVRAFPMQRFQACILLQLPCGSVSLHVHSLPGCAGSVQCATSPATCMDAGTLWW